VVVAAGITIFQPEDGTVPTSWLIETVLALATAQVKVILSPSVIEFLLAEKVFMVGGVFVIAVSAVFVVFVVSTVTVNDLVTEP
jgi:hypothetical protein